jgi:hypothetical protein
MRTGFVAVMCWALWVAAPPALAQQKTRQACQEEWRANRAAYETAGIMLRAYVYKCQAGDTAAPAATPAPVAPATPAPGRGETGSRSRAEANVGFLRLVEFRR